VVVCISSTVVLWWSPLVLPLLAAAVDSGRLLGRGLEHGPEDGNVLLENDRRHSEIALQLLRALAEVLGHVGHVLPLLHLTEELHQAGRPQQRQTETERQTERQGQSVQGITSKSFICSFVHTHIESFRYCLKISTLKCPTFNSSMSGLYACSVLCLFIYLF